jgi:hypothetical protein
MVFGHVRDARNIRVFTSPASAASSARFCWAARARNQTLVFIVFPREIFSDAHAVERAWRGGASMNRPLRRVAIFCGILIMALLLRVNWVQFVQGETLAQHEDNRRVKIAQFAQARGAAR